MPFRVVFRPFHPAPYAPHSRLRSNTLLVLSAGLLAITMVLSAPVQADDPSVSEWDFYGDLPVVLHATRLQQPVADTPASITVIDQALIRASTAATIPELLRHVAGFQVAYPSGNEATATYHGAADQHARTLQVLVDGRSVYNPLTGGMLWETLALTLEDVDRIEVIRGPNAAAYGANAFFGVINIVTKDPAKFPGTSLRVDAGSRDTRRTHLRHAGQAGALQYGLSAFYEEQSGFDTHNDDLRAAHVDFKGNLGLSSRDALEFGFSYREAEAPRGLLARHIEIRDRDADSQHQLLRWRRVDAVDDEMQITLYHNKERAQDKIFPFSLSDYLSFLSGAHVKPEEIPRYAGRPDQIVGVNYNYTAHRYDLEFQRIQRLNDALRVVWGGGYREDRANAPGLLEGGAASRSQRRVFANAEWQPEARWLANLGAMFEDHDEVGDFFSPRLGIAYRIGVRNSLRAVASRAYRMPTLLEYRTSEPVFWSDGGIVELIEAPGTIDLDLNRSASLQPRPERIDAYEIGFFGQFADQRLSADVKFFYKDIRHVVGQAKFDRINRRELRTYFNRYTLRHQGFETQLLYQSGPHFASLGYSYVDNRQEGGISHTMVPRHTLSTLYAHQFPKALQISLGAFYVDTMQWRGEGQRLGSTQWVDLKIEKGLDLRPGRVTLGFSVHNLFDVDNATFRTENQDDRRLLATARLEF